VPSSAEFWVDLYVEPEPIPTGVNQVWNDGRSSEGLVWGVTASALPLQPGQELRLIYDSRPGAVNPYLVGEYSRMAGPVAEGTPVYVQVDSANRDSSYGAVLESHELAGAGYNNIRGPVFVTASGVSQLAVERQSEGIEPAGSGTNLPPR
jgi:hypothetical protein